MELLANFLRYLQGYFAIIHVLAHCLLATAGGYDKRSGSYLRSPRQNLHEGFGNKAYDGADLVLHGIGIAKARAKSIDNDGTAGAWRGLSENSGKVADKKNVEQLGLTVPGRHDVYQR